jgi:uncharacterized protein
MNTLFPIFLKTDETYFLIVGGGRIGHEKASTLLKQSPKARVRLVAKEMSDEVKGLTLLYPNLELIEKSYDINDLEDIDIVIAATDDGVLNTQIKKEANNQKILVNAADQPALCDFYLGSIVNKGQLKIAISTNGKSPVMARRIREYLEIEIPENVTETIENLNSFRNAHKGNFSERLNDLNKITSSLTSEKKEINNKYRKLALNITLLFFAIFIGYGLSAFYSTEKMVDFLSHIPKEFYGMIIVGILAQLVDGAVGLGYGVVSATSMMMLGINITNISGSVHMAEMVSSGLSGFSHYKFGNVNMKLFRWIGIAGAIGAVFGALTLIYVGKEYQNFAYAILSAYTFFIGIKLVILAFRKNYERKKIKKAGVLGFVGGFFDAFGGGGWGPIVASTLISNGRKTSFVVGTVSLAEFFVTLAASSVFFLSLGVSNWYIVAGLIIGGAISAPIAARLTGKINQKLGMLLVAFLVCVFSVRVLMKVL